MRIERFDGGVRREKKERNKTYENMKGKKKYILFRIKVLGVYARGAATATANNRINDLTEFVSTEREGERERGPTVDSTATLNNSTEIIRMWLSLSSPLSKSNNNNNIRVSVVYNAR